MKWLLEMHSTLGHLQSQLTFVTSGPKRILGSIQIDIEGEHMKTYLGMGLLAIGALVLSCGTAERKSGRGNTSGAEGAAPTDTVNQDFGRDIVSQKPETENFSKIDPPSESEVRTLASTVDSANSGFGFNNNAGAQVVPRLVYFTKGCVTPHIVELTRISNYGYSPLGAADVANLIGRQYYQGVIAQIRRSAGAMCFNDYVQGVGSNDYPNLRTSTCVTATAITNNVVTGRIIARYCY